MSVALAAVSMAIVGVVTVATPVSAASALDTARAEIGVTEGSSRANSYGAAVGRYDSTYNYAWCATFISWVMQQSGASPVRSASVADWLGKAQRNQDGLSITTTPRAGDLVAFDWDGNGDYAWGNRHIGMVESVQSSTSFTTIEGNTGNPNGSNDGVYRRTRSGFSQPNQVKFIRVAGAASSISEPQPRPEAPDGWYTQSISASLASGAGVASQESGSLDVFNIDPSGNVRQQYFRKSQSQSWVAGANFGVPVGGAVGRPAADSWGLGRLDMFVRTGNSTLAQRYFSNGTWSGWAYPAVGTLLTSPAVATWGTNRVDVFSVSSSGRLTQAYYDGTWKSFREVADPLPNGDYLSGAPAAVSWGANRIDVVARGNSGRVYQTYWNGSAWGPWRDLMATAGTSLRAAAGDSVGISSWGAGRLDVFVKMTDGYTWHQWYDNSAWSGFQNLATTSPNGPSAVSWGYGRVDVFYRTPASTLGHDWFQRA